MCSRNRMVFSSDSRLYWSYINIIFQPSSTVDFSEKALTVTYLPAKRRSGAPGGRSQTPSLCCLPSSGPSSSFLLTSWIRLDRMTMTLILPSGFQKSSAAGASAWWATGHGVVSGSSAAFESLDHSRWLATHCIARFIFSSAKCTKFETALNQWASLKKAKLSLTLKSAAAEGSALHFLLMCSLFFLFPKPEAPPLSLHFSYLLKQPSELFTFVKRQTTTPSVGGLASLNVLLTTGPGRAGSLSARPRPCHLHFSLQRKLNTVERGRTWRVTVTPARALLLPDPHRCVSSLGSEKKRKKKQPSAETPGGKNQLKGSKVNTCVPTLAPHRLTSSSSSSIGWWRKKPLNFPSQLPECFFVCFSRAFSECATALRFLRLHWSSREMRCSLSLQSIRCCLRVAVPSIGGLHHCYGPVDSSRTIQCGGRGSSGTTELDQGRLHNMGPADSKNHEN